MWASVWCSSTVREGLRFVLSLGLVMMYVAAMLVVAVKVILWMSGLLGISA